MALWSCAVLFWLMQYLTQFHQTHTDNEMNFTASVPECSNSTSIELKHFVGLFVSIYHTNAFLHLFCMFIHEKILKKPRKTKQKINIFTLHLIVVPSVVKLSHNIPLPIRISLQIVQAFDSQKYIDIESVDGKHIHLKYCDAVIFNGYKFGLVGFLLIQYELIPGLFLLNSFLYKNVKITIKHKAQ